MKKTLTILGLTACGFGVPSLHATPDTVYIAPPTKVKPRHSTIYITSVTAIGSHIPLVVRAYDGSITPMSPTYAYGRADIVNTGSSEDVAQALTLRDPSLSFNRR